MKTCVYCKATIVGNQYATTTHGIACRSCWLERMAECEACAGWTEKQDLTRVNGKDFCKGCLSRLTKKAGGCVK